MQSTKIILYSLLIGSLLIGCNQGKKTKGEGKGQNSEKRLVVTNSDALEMLIGLGASENIVGVNDDDIIMETFGAKNPWPSIGSWRNPNLEAIINLKPDIAITYPNSPAPASFDDKLKPFNISVERVDCFRMSEYHSDMNRLASLTGKEKMADTLIHDFDRIVNMIKNAVADIDLKKKVYIEYGDFIAMGEGSGNNEMIELINATNIAAKLKILYPKISTEWLLEENPDIIIKVISSDTIISAIYEQVVNRAGWNKLNAVKNKQVYLISPEICSGPRAMIGSLYFGKWCYPEKFASIDPDSVHAYWLKKYYGVPFTNKYVFNSNDISKR